MVVLFSREQGRIDALAKGARREKSPMRGGLDLFNHEEVMIYERSRGGLDLVTECDPIAEFVGIRRSALTYSVACLLGEILLHGCMVRDPHPRSFDIFREALTRLCSRDGAEAVMIDALFGILGDLGFQPLLDGCASCGAGLPENRRLVLSGRRGGLVCPECAGGAEGLELSRRGVAALRFLASASAGGRERLSLPEEEMMSLAAAAMRYAEDSLERELKGAAIFRQLRVGKGAA